jgi:hypothetical protein
MQPSSANNIIQVSADLSASFPLQLQLHLNLESICIHHILVPRTLEQISQWLSWT